MIVGSLYLVFYVLSRSLLALVSEARKGHGGARQRRDAP